MAADRAHQRAPTDKPEILDDPRLEPASAWLRRLDWFTPEPGLWVGDANENFLEHAGHGLARTPARRRVSRQSRVPSALPCAAPAAPQLGRQRQRHRLALRFRRMGAGRPEADRRRSCNGCKPPRAASSNCPMPAGSNWTPNAVQSAHETMADLGVDGLVAVPQTASAWNRRAHLDEAGLQRFADSPQAKALRESLKDFKGIPSTTLPANDQGRPASLSEGRFRFPLPPHARSSSAAFWPTTWVWAKRCRR